VSSVLCTKPLRTVGSEENIVGITSLLAAA
jgi:hypothetical protein